MTRVFDAIRELARDDGFTSFQNDVISRSYDALGQGYALGNNEVALVKRLVDAANGRSYGSIRLLATMLHGSRSYVEFDYLDKPVTKELGDMAIITVVTSGRQRLLQKTCIVQNKKSTGKGWSIDLEQLFLLKNFPAFSGNKGIFRDCHNLTFRNASGCLGAFGLLESPGEMILISAPLMSELVRGRKSLSSGDISVLSGSSDINTGRADVASSFLLWPGIYRFHPKEWPFVLEEIFERFGYPLGFVRGAGGHAFLGNSRFSRDLYDITRSWTQLSIGELSYAYDTILNESVDAFSNFLMRSAGFYDLFEFPGDDVFGDREFDGQLAVFVIHMDVKREG